MSTLAMFAVAALWCVALLETAALCSIARTLFAGRRDGSSKVGGLRLGEKLAGIPVATSTGERIVVGPGDLPFLVVCLNANSAASRLATLWLPHLQRRPEYRCLTVVSGPAGTIRRVLEETGCTQSIVPDPGGQLCAKLGVADAPSVVIIDRWGRFAGKARANRYDDVELLLADLADGEPGA